MLPLAQRLSEMTGDETWRAEGAGRTFKYAWQPNGWTQCHRITFSSPEAKHGLRTECSAEEAAEAELPPPTGLLSKMLVNFGYPIIPGLSELPCMD